MEQDIPQKKIRKAQFEFRYEIDAHLPHWARRTHPIVRRHLGQYWRVMPVPYETLFIRFLQLSGLVLLTIWLDFLLTIALPISIVSIAVLIFLAGYYMQALYALALDSSASMAAEIEGHTLDTVRTTPLTTREILLGKIAGALWLRGESLNMVMSTVTYSQLPTLLLVGIASHDIALYRGWVQLAVVILFASVIVRVPLEMFMVAAIGQFIGMTTPGRSAAGLTTLTVIALYFLTLYGLWLVRAPLWLDVIIKGVIPVVVPALASLALVEITRRRIEEP